jgi:aspartate/methionine/tyrosine aminotransferase
MQSSHLAKRVLNVTPSPTVSLPDKARDLRRNGIEVIDLSEGQPHFDTPAPIKEAAKAAIDAGFVFYVQSAGLPELREEIKKKLLRDNEIDVPTSRIMVTVGAKQAIFTAMLCTINDGDEVLIPDPYWGSHASMVEVVGGHPVSVHIKHEKQFTIDLEYLERSVTSRTKMVVLSSPHNPTGMVVNKDSLETIADICRRRSILVIADEIYEKLVYDGVRHYSIGSMPGMEDLAITVNGFSKEFSMTGWRLGYVAAPKEIFDKMLVVQQHSVTHPTAFVQKAGVVALRDCGKQVGEMVQYYKKARDYFVTELGKLDYFQCEMPQGAFYAFPRITKHSVTSADLCDRMLDEAKVLGVPGSAFGKYGEGHVRFVYAQQIETLSRTIESLKKIK